MKKAPKAYKDQEFINSRDGRILRILSEYIAPEAKFRDTGVNHTVVFFGSARIKPEDDTLGTAKYYNAARQLASELALYSRELKEETGDNFYICTGGGPGIMEAANRGAIETGEKTVGLNISLPFEQFPNPYISDELNMEFHYFFMRKLWLLYHAKAIIVFPGGFGTFDELFETLTLIQTKKMAKPDISVMLYDSSYWSDLINFQKLVDLGMISREDLNLFHFFNTVEEGMEYLKPRLKDIIATVDHYIP
ncbi:MAG TPA: TIGR00730 family Rossman fold protein [Spirochaetota bacterium]|nr:TIGR00730 family Rossman fold protein [Spirochaetota bacterium]HPJ35364.1 TIGR00730 family Rossman fold protein [Spirochaetota bacterium]